MWHYQKLDLMDLQLQYYSQLPATNGGDVNFGPIVSNNPHLTKLLKKQVNTLQDRVEGPTTANR